jgi:SAM-dependent methyltransferase
MSESKKNHWETVYTTKSPNEVSWTQEIPKTSLDFIKSFKIDKSDAIIDIGGGDSNLADHLLKEGYTNITVLDISGKAIERAKKRLGNLSEKVQWIESDIVDFKPTQKYNIWHDRAAFHFLTEEEDIKNYINTLNSSAIGFVVLGTFAKTGPFKCSGLEITQYDESSMIEVMPASFEKISCKTETHTTPFGTTQNFQFCSFRKKP